MSAMATVYMKQAIQFDYQGAAVQLGLGYNRLPQVILNDFIKSEFYEALLAEGKIKLNAQHGGTDDEKRRKAQASQIKKLSEARKRSLPGPSDLVQAREITDAQGAPTGRWELCDRLHEKTGRTFDEETEAFSAAQAHNDKAWAAWLADKAKK